MPEETQARSQGYLEVLVDSMVDGLWVIDTQGRTMDVNPAMVRMLGYDSKAELSSRNPSDITAEESRGETAKTIKESLSGANSNGEINLVRKDGRKISVSVISAALKDIEGKITGAFAIIRDISETKKIQEELSQSRERYALALEGSNDGLWDWNVITNEVYFSPRWKSMLGYEDHEIANNFSSWENILHPDDLVRAKATIQDYFSGKTATYSLEHRLRGKDGKYRWILARGKALKDSENRIFRMIGSNIDITEQKNHETELMKAKQDVEGKNRELEVHIGKLEKLTQLAIERESKIAELKREIKSLKKN